MHSEAFSCPGQTSGRQRPDVRSRHSMGFTLLELLLIVGIAGLAMTAATVYWNKTLARTETRSAARLAKAFIHRARMNAIFEGVNYFVVLDPSKRRLEIYADTGTTVASFDDADERVASTSLKVNLALPTEPANLSHPLDASALNSAWSLPLPDPDARWGSDLVGLMLTPTGRMQSAALTPVTIGTGAIIFSDAKNNTAAVGIRGREGAIRSFVYANEKWKAL